MELKLTLSVYIVRRQIYEIRVLRPLIVLKKSLQIRYNLNQNGFPPTRDDGKRIQSRLMKKFRLYWTFPQRKYNEYVRLFIQSLKYLTICTLHSKPSWHARCLDRIYKIFQVPLSFTHTLFVEFTFCFLE